MEGITNLLNKTKNNMGEHVARLERDLATIRTGRASAGLLENIRVDYYGTPTPIKQMAVINILDAKTLEIQPWDISSLNDIDRALQKADLGASPVNDGKVIRITLPSMTEDRRKQLAKNISKMSEDFKVAVRNERRDVLEKLKKAQKIQILRTLYLLSFYTALYSTAYPFAFMRSTILYTYFSHSSSVAASTITLMTGSVPLCLRRSLPSSPSSAAISSFSFSTSASFMTASLLETLTFTRSCGYIVRLWNSSESLTLRPSIVSMIISEVRTPSPVVAYLEKMICPDCSPPMECPCSIIFSNTYLSPTAVFS